MEVGKGRVGTFVQEGAVSHMVLRELQQVTPDERPSEGERGGRETVGREMSKYISRLSCKENAVTDLYFAGYSPNPFKMDFSFSTSSPTFPPPSPPSTPPSTPPPLCTPAVLVDPGCGALGTREMDLSGALREA